MAGKSDDKNQNNLDTGAIEAGNKEMLAVMQDVFSVLNNLGKQQQTEMTTENEALTSFLSAESALNDATNRFAGPSPRFYAPTWMGSQSHPKRASYKTEFTPVIKAALTAPTVQSDESAIAAQLLESNIKATFHQKALELGLKKGGSGIPGDLTDDTNAMEWVADSVISLSGTVPEATQTALANALIKQVKKIKTTTLYTNIQTDDYWENVESIEEPDTSAKVAINTAIEQVNDFISTMWVSLSDTPLPGKKTSGSDATDPIQNAIQKQLESTIKSATIKGYLTNLSEAEQTTLKDSITDTVNEALKGLPKTAPSGTTRKANYNTIQALLKGYSSHPTSNPFIKGFPPSKTSTSDYKTWDGSFWDVIHQVLVGSTAAEASAIAKKVNSVLSALHGTYKTLPRNPLNPNAPISDENEITGWVMNTVTNLISKKTVTLMQGEHLKSGLIDVVTRLFPIPDQISFYQTFQDNLKNALLKLPSLHAGSSASENSKTGEFVPDSQQEDKLKKSQQGHAEDQKTLQVVPPSGKGNSTGDSKDGNGLLHAISSNVSASNLQSIAKNVLKKDPSNSVAQALVGASSANDISEITNDLKSTLVSSMEDIVNQAITNVFVSLSEQGVQGQMISTAYDYQIINRISNYTSTLLNQLDKHYDKDVPTNSAESIAAAQSITSASVSYRNYANDLDSLYESYQRAGETSNSNSGRSTAQLNTYIDGSHSSGSGPAWSKSLTQISDAIYSTSSSEESLILTSEFDAVQLAANAAGFGSNLTDEFVQERTNAENALNSLLTNTQQLFATTQTSYDTLAKDYFTALADYTETREAYQIDEAMSSAYDSALAGLTGIMETSEIAFDSASLATLASNS